MGGLLYYPFWKEGGLHTKEINIYNSAKLFLGYLLKWSEYRYTRYLGPSIYSPKSTTSCIIYNIEYRIYMHLCCRDIQTGERLE